LSSAHGSGRLCGPWASVLYVAQIRGEASRAHAPDPRARSRPAANIIQRQERFDGFLAEFNTERPHQALAMKRPADIDTAAPRPYRGLPELACPLHDRDIVVTACGRLCMHRKKIDISTLLAGRRVGIKEVDEGIWLVSFMHYDLG
jgi:hypothetical protein